MHNVGKLEIKKKDVLVLHVYQKAHQEGDNILEVKINIQRPILWADFRYSAFGFSYPLPVSVKK